MAQERRFGVFECVDAHDSVETIVDSAGDYRHDTALRADVKLRSLCSETVARDERRVLDHDSQCCPGIGCPDASMLDAERATARAGRNFGWIGFPREREGNVPAVTASSDQHVCS